MMTILRIPLLATLLVLLVTEPAAAQAIPPVPAGFLNDILNQYSNATAPWLDASMAWASVIFTGLVGVEIAWSLVEVWLKQRELEALISSLLHRIIWVGSAIFILNVAPTIVTAAIQDFLNIGAGIASASGTPTNMTPDSVFHTGYAIAQGMMNASNGDAWYAQALEALPQIVGALLVLIAYAVVAGQFLLTEIQVCLVVGGGAFLLGFIGSRWTLPFAETYPRMVVQSGMKLIAVTLVVGLGNALGNHWIAVAQTNGGSALTYLTIGTSSIVYAIIAWNLPSIIQSFAGASPALSASSIAAGATAMGRAAAATLASRGGGAPSRGHTPPAVSTSASIESAAQTV